MTNDRHTTKGDKVSDVPEAETTCTLPESVMHVYGKLIQFPGRPRHRGVPVDIQCTAKTAQGKRCRNYVACGSEWDFWDASGVSIYGLNYDRHSWAWGYDPNAQGDDPGEDTRRQIITQRCPLHDKRCGEDWVKPEWVLYDLGAALAAVGR